MSYIEDVERELRRLLADVLARTVAPEVLLSFDKYTFSNSVAACWSCNHLKGGMPRFAFEQELKSLAEAVAGRR